MIQNEESSYKYDQKIQLFFMYVSDENTSNMLHDTTKARIEIRVYSPVRGHPEYGVGAYSMERLVKSSSPVSLCPKALPTCRQSQPSMKI